MKVQELRDLLSRTDRRTLEKAFVESYKQFSKAKKEEVDEIIINVLNGNEATAAKKAKAVNFEELEMEIRLFLENAYAQNYFAPNRAVPKNQRSKWRFLVKGYIKELQEIPLENENYEMSVKLLNELYQMLCEACNYYLFSTDDPFRSVGMKQPEIFEILVKRTFLAGYSRENISDLLLLACSGGLSREALHIFQEMVLIAGLRTSDSRHIAIEEAMKLVDTRCEKLRKNRNGSVSQYGLTDAVNELCGVVLMLSVRLGKADDGIRYYFSHCKKNDKEIVLYCALYIMEWMGEDDIWLKIYEFGIKNKIQPRQELIDKYQQRKEGIE